MTKKDNVFLIVDKSHTFIDSDGMRHEHPNIDVTPLGRMSRKDLLEYKQTIDNTYFRQNTFCMQKIETKLKTTKSGAIIRLDIQLFPAPLLSKCECIYHDECPFFITHGECKHPLVKEIIGKRFRAQMYEKQK
jgi:hypothetical protein